jgi:hypothetical protein
MEAMRSTWTDARLDEFKDQVNANFKELGQRVDHQSERIDRIQHTMVHGFIAVMLGMMTGFLGLAGVLITKL